MAGYRGRVVILTGGESCESAEALLWREPVRGGGSSWAGILRLSALSAAQLNLAAGTIIRVRVPNGLEALATIIDEPLDDDSEVEVAGHGPPPFT